MGGCLLIKSKREKPLLWMLTGRERQIGYFYKMDLVSFVASLNTDTPPEDISVYLLALWYDAKGDWEKSHTTIQHVDTKNAEWIHAYLHRKEGDIFNADYWYRRAGKKRPSVTLKQEWNELVTAMMEQ